MFTLTCSRGDGSRRDRGCEASRDSLFFRREEEEEDVTLRAAKHALKAEQKPGKQREKEPAPQHKEAPDTRAAPHPPQAQERTKRVLRGERKGATQQTGKATKGQRGQGRDRKGKHAQAAKSAPLHPGTPKHTQPKPKR